jgi:hypothetical protein
MPWHLDAATAGLIGVIVGAALKWTLDLVTERKRRQHENRIRFMDKRLECAAQFFTVLESLRDQEMEYVHVLKLIDDNKKDNGAAEDEGARRRAGY